MRVAARLLIFCATGLPPLLTGCLTLPFTLPGDRPFVLGAAAIVGLGTGTASLFAVLALFRDLRARLQRLATLGERIVGHARLLSLNLHPGSRPGEAGAN